MITVKDVENNDIVYPVARRYKNTSLIVLFTSAHKGIAIQAGFGVALGNDEEFLITENSCEPVWIPVEVTIKG